MIIHITQDSRYVAVKYHSHNVFRVWRVVSGELVMVESTGGLPHHFQFSRDGKVLVVGDFDIPLDGLRMIEL